MGQLEPGAGEGVGELVGMLVEAPRDLLVGRVDAQREIRGQHGRHVPLRRIVGVGDRGTAVLRLPLVRAGRALGELPFVVEQVVEEVVAPLRRRLRPGDFRATGDRVLAFAGAELADPAQALRLDAGRFRLRSHQGRIAGAMGLAEGVAAGDQCHGLLVVHRHARERLADVAGRREGIGIAVRPFRIDVDQAHLHGAQRVLKFAVAAVALVRQPLAFRPPVDVGLGLPGVDAPGAEAERLEAHGFEGDVAGEDEEVGPRDLGAVFLLDRPQQPAGLVQVGVVGPAVEWREALLAAAGTAAAVADPIRPGAVPGHADEERPIVAEVGRPPILRLRHQGVEILDHGVEIEAVEFLGVVEGRAHRVGQRGVLVKDLKVELVRPPVTIRRSSPAARERAFAFSRHGPSDRVPSS